MALDTSIVVSLIDKFVAPAEKVASVSDKMTSRMEASQKRLQGLERQAGSVRNYQVLENRLSKTAQEMRQAQQRTAKLRAELRATAEPTTKLKNDFERARAASTRLSRKHKDQTNELGRLRTELRQAGLETRNLGDQQRRTAENIAQTTQRMEALAKQTARVEAAQTQYDKALERAANISLVADGLERTGRTLTGALRAPLNEALKLESALADVKKVVDFEDDASFLKLKNRLREMARKEIPITREGLVAIAAAGGQFGRTAEELPDFVEDAAKVAVAFDIYPEAAGEAMAKLSNVYKIPIANITSLTDAINHLSNNAAVKAHEVINAMQRSAGNADSFKLTAVQVAALTSTMIELGKEPAVAGTAINAMLTKLHAARGQSEKFKDALLDIGFSVDDMEAAIADNAQGALSDFLERLAELDNQQRVLALNDLFGLEYSDDLALLASGLDKYRKALALVAREEVYAGSTEREFQERSATRANRLQLMEQRWQDVELRIGERLLPMLDRFLNAIEPVIDAVGRWVDRFPGFVSVLAGTIGIIGGIALVAAPVVTAVASLTIAVALLGKTSRQSAANVAAAAAMNGAGAAGGFAGGDGKKPRGRLGKWGRIGGIAGAVLGVATVGSTLLDDQLERTEKAEKVTGDVASIAGGVGGAALAGAAVGSVFPGIGTAIGAVLGGIVGSIAGGEIGDSLGGFLFGDDDKTVVKTEPLKTQKATQNVTRHGDQFSINVTQQAGEDTDALVQRVTQEIQSLQQDNFQGALFDAG